MQGNPDEIAKIVAQRGNTAQQIQMFGSTNAAAAMAKSSSDNGHSRAANDALEATRLSFMEHPIDSLKDVSHSFLSGIAYYTQRAGRAYGGGMSFEQAGAEMDSEAKGKEAKEALDRTITARKEAGSKFGEGLLTVGETNAANAKTEATNNYSDISALTGVSAETFKARAETERHRKQQGFDSQYQNVYERQDAQAALIGEDEKNGRLNGTQAYRAQWANWDQTAAAVSGTRSNAQNLGNAMTSFGGKWNDPGIQAAKQKEIDAAQANLDAAKKKLKTAEVDLENLPASDAGQPWESMTGKTQAWHDKRVADINLPGAQKGVQDAQAALDATKGKASLEQRDAARDFGDKLTSYVEGLTSAGPQAGAYGVNTVQGASQMMSAEYQMDQSQDTRRMVELLLQIAVNTGKVTKDQASAVKDNLGYRTNDPLNFLGGN
jgi:hypothetical protein